MILTKDKLTSNSFVDGEKYQLLLTNISSSEKVLESFMEDNKRKLLAIPVLINNFRSLILKKQKSSFVK